jgi:Cdc6-like AAA superfamily ATPase
MTVVESLEKEVLKLAALGDSELLQATHSATTTIAQRITAMSKVLDSNLTRLIDTNTMIRKSLGDKKLSDVLTWLSTVPYALHQKYIAATRIPGSGAWFLKHRDFSTWLASSSSGIFLLHGVRGCGKSTIASLAVDHFQRPSTQPGMVPVQCAYCFCDNSVAEPNRANPESIFRSIVRQLAIDSSSGSIDQAVLDLYEKNLKEADQGKVHMAQLRLEESSSLLLDLTMCNPAYILIDAVDQLDDDSRATLIQALRKLVANSASIVKVFLTSCDNAHVEGLLEDATKLRVAARHNGEDVRAFATAKLKEADMKRRILNGAASRTLLNKMARSLIKGAGEM